MKQILTVFAFTYKDAIRKKVFIISTIIILAAIVIACAIPGISNMLKSDSDTDPGNATVESNADDAESAEELNKICYYVDETGLLADGAESLQAAFTNWKIENGEASEENEYRAQIKESENRSMVKITMQGDMPFITVVNKNVLSGISENTVMEVLSDVYIYATLINQGVAQETIDFAQSTLPGTVEIEGSMNLSGYIIGIVLTMLTFFAVYYYGYGVSMSVATEKTTRVMETLIVSAKPSRILIGKCLGMGAVGLTQFAALFVVAAVCFTTMIPEGFMLGGAPITLDAFDFKSAVLIIVFFLLGYALYAMLNAVCGASVSKIEDLNSAEMPVMMLSLVSFYIAYFAMLIASADSAIQKVALYVPFTSPFIMPYKLLNSDVASSDILISIGLLLVSIAAVSIISIKIYSASVLHYGSKKLKLKDVMNK